MIGYSLLNNSIMTDEEIQNTEFEENSNETNSENLLVEVDKTENEPVQKKIFSIDYIFPIFFLFSILLLSFLIIILCIFLTIFLPTNELNFIIIGVYFYKIKKRSKLLK
jgi:hypothetical protein